MVEWLDSNILYWHWIVFGILLSGAEIFMPSFFLLWLGVSAIIVGVISSLFDLSFSAQIVCWGVLSFSSLVLWFKYIAPRMENKTLSGMSREALIGQEGTVISFSGQSLKGRIRFSAPIVGSDEWNARSDDSLNPGDRTIVTDVSGNDLIVRKK